MAERTPKATAAQIVILQNLAAGRDAGAHLRGKAAYGGFTMTWAALRRRGWIEYDAITDAGRAAIARATSPLVDLVGEGESIETGDPA